MFSRFSRLPLRRCLYTSSGAARPTGSLARSAKIAFGASAVAATYVAWQLTQAQNQISLDSPRAMNSTTERSTLVKPPQRKETPSEPVPSPATAEADVFVPDAPSAPDSGSEPTEEAVASEEGGEAASDDPASGGAFNPETGEINWDCPCLGGMAHGPCGPEFREAFSCFVFSEEEPKGINCVEKFQNMQNCFRAHPDVYADEIMDDDEEDAPSAADASSDVSPSEIPNEETFSGDVHPTTEKAQLESSPIAESS